MLEHRDGKNIFLQDFQDLIKYLVSTNLQKNDFVRTFINLMLNSYFIIQATEIIIVMSTTNANYLLSPNRLSTKVHYAPGGASSLSLAWDEKPSPKMQRSFEGERLNQIQQEQIPRFRSQEQLKESMSPIKGYYQPSQIGYVSLGQSNRMLEQQLKYYQNKNKRMRENIFGGVDNLVSNYSSLPNSSIRSPHYQKKYSNMSGYHSNRYDPTKMRGRQSSQIEQLQMAIHKQEKSRVYDKVDYTYEGSNEGSPYNYLKNQEKTSVKVSNPPGGRSRIFLG